MLGGDGFTNTSKRCAVVMFEKKAMLQEGTRPTPTHIRGQRKCFPYCTNSEE